MKKIIALSAIVLALVGCDASTENRSHKYIMPEGMEDCRVFRMEGDGGAQTLYVVRCPNSQVNTNWSQYNTGTKTYHDYHTYTNSNNKYL